MSPSFTLLRSRLRLWHTRTTIATLSECSNSTRMASPPSIRTSATNAAARRPSLSAVTPSRSSASRSWDLGYSPLPGSAAESRHDASQEVWSTPTTGTRFHRRVAGSASHLDRRNIRQPRRSRPSHQRNHQRAVCAIARGQASLFFGRPGHRVDRWRVLPCEVGASAVVKITALSLGRHHRTGNDRETYCF